MMTQTSEEIALQAVEQARVALRAALDTLQKVRGESADEPCRGCDGEGKDPLGAIHGRLEPCSLCNGSGRLKKTLPWIVTRIKWDSEPLKHSVFHRGVTWVRVRPCDDECAGKTYLGWLLGDMVLSQMAQLESDGTLRISMAQHNPAIFVPDLGRVVFGCGSWWAPIKTPEDLKTISDADIQDVWYVKALRDVADRAS